jgi:Zinc carboxypeptidase
MQHVTNKFKSKIKAARLIQFLIVLLMIQSISCTPWQRHGVPEKPDPRYFTYDQILDQFARWDSEYPGIFQSEFIGPTGSGRDSIVAACISSSGSRQNKRPTLIFHAAQHSNESNGTNAIIEMMTRLLFSYGHDDYYTSMVEGLNIWFIPVVNVDGHRKAFAGIDGWVDWRKTLRDNDRNGLFSGFADGVDLNRNWDHRWHEYPDKGPEHSMYKGPHPFSEVETVVMRDFILRKNPLFLMDYHSPGVVTPGNVVFWPWVDKETGTSGVDAPVYAPIAQALVERTLTEVDSVFMKRMASYNTLPKEQCWVYANTGLCVFLMEISSKFWWEGPLVNTIAERIADGSFYLMERALSGPGVTGQVTESLTGRPIEAEIRVTEIHDPEIGPRLCNDAGMYWRLLTEGEYTITAHWNGQRSEPKQISISGAQWVTVDFEIEPAR